MTLPPTFRLPDRRLVLKALGASAILLSSTALTRSAFAQPTTAEPFAFSFDALSERMRDMAAAPYTPVTFELPPVFAGLDYDTYRLIKFRPDRGKWAGTDSAYQVQAFHLGWLYSEPVKLFEIEAGNATALDFTAADFEYLDTDVETTAMGTPFPGVAGFRINHPLNKSSRLDELISFLGASYFRALGRNNIYGLSARGLVINSWNGGTEEFPRFSEFYLERPVNGGDALLVYAALESQSVTGAYRFEIHPASDAQQETVIDVTARLYFRTDVEEIGIAPLTSMFLYADANRAGFDDYRPQVHDSNGLLIERQSGEVMWRALSNTPSLGNSYFWENDPHAFGLYQRGRDFQTYQDAGAHYERRPSTRIEPVGSWGQGSIRLIEIPTKLEVDDNIVAFWVPVDPVKAGDSREYQYRMIWGDLNPDVDPSMAYVLETRAGVGGVSGVANAAELRKFVIDFKGGELPTLPYGTPVDILANASGGQIVSSTLTQIEETGVWRVVIDVETNGPDPLELKAYLVGLGRKLTETWLYQWRASA